ncbi:transcriptional regulator [Tomitella gaofuii]|uniref:transcriptional regulator n=1 Tax=Tomitella gaofuii TaxID=2760083 RepID=UPI001C70F21A|nr:transcriptional regulator [Tomitella gaofuii]
MSELIHQKTRLGIMALLREASSAEFRLIASTLNLTAGNLSRHIAILENAGLVKTSKGYVGKRPRTWVAITHTGRTELAKEVKYLKKIIDSHPNE